MAKPQVSEEAFRQQVRQLAAMYGWTLTYHTHNSRRSDAGWVDEVIAHPTKRRVLFIELKTDIGKISRAQDQWIHALKSAGLEAAVWRPKDMPDIVETLGPSQRRLNQEVTAKTT